MVTVKELAAKILEVFREVAERKGVAEIPATSIYETFLRDSSHDMVQRAIRHLVDRDFIAPHSYSLTAKGRIRQVENTATEEQEL